VLKSYADRHSPPAEILKSSSRAKTITAPRIRQIEQLQRSSLANPSESCASKRTLPQWH
jgi:hypothetical protein